MSIKTKILIALTSLCLYSCLWTDKDLNKHQEPSKYLMKGTHVSPQISFLNINSFCQDSLGYMWIATLGGLNRYNGYEFVQYIHDEDDSTSINDDFVFSLFLDSSHRLWVGTTSGINRYNFESNRFIRYHSPFVISSFFEDHNKRLWAATSAGPGWIDTLENKVVLSSDKQQHVNLFWEDSAQRLWMGTNDKQSLAVLQNDGEWDCYSLPDNKRVISMYSDPQNVWWFGTNAGLVLFDPTSRTFKEPPPSFTKTSGLASSQINFICETEPLKLLIGTATQGIFEYDILSQTLSHNLPEGFNSFISSQLLTCYVDTRKNVWIGSYDKGFIVHNKSLDYFNMNHELTKFLKNKFVTRIIEDSFSNLWISTRYDGLYCYTSTKKIISYESEKSDFFPKNDEFLETLFIDSKNRIWIGFDNQLIVGKITSEGQIDVQNKLELKNTRVIKEDNDGNIWIGTWSGFFKISHSQPTNIEKICSGNISDICILQSGNVLFSSYGIGLMEITTNDTIPKFRELPAESATVSHKCISIFEDSRQQIWIGSYGNGMSCITEQDCFVFTRDDGLPSNNILCIQEDINNDLWMSTSHGISKLKLSVADTIFTNYFRSDGILGDQYHEKAGCRRSDGYLFFGGNHGITFFNPTTILPNRMPPTIHLEDLKILNQSVQPSAKGSVLTKGIAFTDKIILNHTQTSISLDYAGIDYLTPDKLTYKYKMEGFDQNWIYVDNFRRATYSNLPTGKYTFLVSAINGDGVESLQSASIEIEVKPAPWYSWKAWILYIILLISIIATIFRFSFKIKINKQLLEIEHKEREREQEISEMKINFFTNISHELRTPLTLISAPIERLINMKTSDKDSLWLLNIISRNVQSMLRLINQLLDFTKIENGGLSLYVEKVDIMEQIRNIQDTFTYTANKKHINIEFIPHILCFSTWLDVDKFEKILHNLLSNALKHTPTNGFVEIRSNELSDSEACNKYNDITLLDKSCSYIEISVSDTGKGIPTDKLNDLFVRYRQINDSSGLRPDYSGSGIGLHYTKRLIEMHKGQILAERKSEGGMIFAFIIPSIDIYTEDEKERVDIVSETTTSFICDEVSQIPNIEIEQQVHTILIVEDNVELMEFIKNMLSSKYRLITAIDGEDAWRFIEKESPDLVISDVVMPKVSGYQLCSQIKEHPVFCHIPVILLTAKTTIFDQVEGLEHGADSYICKPFNVDYLLLTIKNLFIGRDRLQQYFSTPQTDNGQKIPVTLNKHDQRFIDKLTALIEEELSNTNLNIDFIARDIGFSRTGFYRKIKGLTNMSPIDFIISYRLRRAAEMIAERDFSLTEISEKTGFNSYSYFSKLFKKHFGINPKDYNN